MHGHCLERQGGKLKSWALDPHLPATAPLLGMPLRVTLSVTLCLMLRRCEHTIRDCLQEQTRLNAVTLIFYAPVLTTQLYDRIGPSHRMACHPVLCLTTLR